ncbi:PREDICTED: origin recognition complex subunit 1-like [Amphimedon queenslandica]|uniref:Uncharacterized protein n=1 Tax=Amphimedon queenslandica TaxID=400682 RepID=A0AAN0J9X1_AMPQE|nr:PREDICTED: origin recognition complex subunit 1-like [Amphimedon queenslandica]|eukprot:XP_019853526.1 PREDICTED: origin recognition complex subunit 1-like [Amphimedon queenslandica]
MATGSLLEQTARKWLEGNMEGSNADYDTNTKRLNVQTPAGDFYIIDPEGKEDNWTVWSDDTSTAQRFSPHIDYFTFNKTLTQVLEKIKECMTTSASATSDSGGEEEEEEEDGEDDEGYDYYGLDDDDYNDDDDDVKEKEQNEDEQEVSADDFFTGDGSPGAVHRLLADLKNMNKSDGKFGISGCPRGDNLFVWDV